MSKILKILLSIPSILIVILVLYNFFADLSSAGYDMIFNVLLITQIFYLIGLIFILISLWKNDNQSKDNKWTWTLLMIFCLQPITTLVYLWAVEPTKK